DISNDLDGQHSTDERKSYHNTLRWHIMWLEWGYVISIGQICTNVWLKQEMVCARRRTWDPGITWLKILKEHIEDKVRIMQISQENGQSRTNTDTGKEREYKSRENAIKG
ncbi:hypothetical protein Tco_0229852, partial [Tanacetum coccineum]